MEEPLLMFAVEVLVFCAKTEPAPNTSDRTSAPANKRFFMGFWFSFKGKWSVLRCRFRKARRQPASPRGNTFLDTRPPTVATSVPALAPRAPFSFRVFL